MKEGSMYREFFTLGYPLPYLNLLGYWVLQGSTRAWSSMLVVRYLCVLGLWYLILWFLLSRVVFCTTLKSPM